MKHFPGYPVINMKATGRNIEHLRKEQHLRVRDVAEFMGFDATQAVYKWQRGESLPSVDNLLALSRLLGVSMEDLLVADQEVLPFFIFTRAGIPALSPLF